MNEIRAIQTEYRGYLFRSRLEVRWAVFFDACGVDWEYEPEGYDLGNGLYYLPDFLLHGVTINHGYFKKNCDIYVEVKGQMNDADAEKINRFYAAGYPEGNDWGVSHTAVLVVGNIPDGEDIANMALLSSTDNAALNNSTFDVKRNEIIKMDKAGQYIPFCTRMVFLKYYTPSADNQLHFWGHADRVAYVDAMNTVLVNYLEEPIVLEKEEE